MQAKRRGVLEGGSSAGERKGTVPRQEREERDFKGIVQTKRASIGTTLLKRGNCISELVRAIESGLTKGRSTAERDRDVNSLKNGSGRNRPTSTTSGGK